MKKIFPFLLSAMLFLGFAFTSYVFTPYAQADQLISAVESVSLPEPDFDAMFASHAPQEVVAVVNGHDISWEDYFYFYCSAASSLYGMMQYYANFGTQLSWSEVYDSSTGITFAQLPVITAGQDLMQFLSIADFLSDSGITLNETSEATLAEMLLADIEAYSAGASAVGEASSASDGSSSADETPSTTGDTSSDSSDSSITGEPISTDSEADPNSLFAAYLAANRLPEHLYHFLSRTSVLYQQAFTDLYGENGSSVPDDAALAYLQANGYVSGVHIYFAFNDAFTGKVADEDSIRAKREQASTLVTELNAVEDVQQRRSLFASYRAELDEDATSFYFPDDYTLCSGYIPEELFAALRAADDFSVFCLEAPSGLYVAMKLPLNPDGLTGYSEQGTPLTGRALFANEDYASSLQSYLAETDFQYVEGFLVPDITEYLS